MLPMFDINFKSISDHFNNCYLSYNSLSFDLPILILNLNKKIELNIDKNIIIDEIEDVDNYIFILKIPEDFYNDYELLLNGKYSKISKELLKRIENYWGKNSQPYKVIIKDPSRKQWLEERIEIGRASCRERVSSPV